MGDRAAAVITNNPLTKMVSITRRIALRNRIMQRRARHGKDAEFLFRHAADNIADKLNDLKKPLQNLLILNPRDAALLEALEKAAVLQKTAKVTFCEPAASLRQALARNIADLSSDVRNRLVLKEEIQAEDLPFDGVLAFFTLHWQAQVSPTDLASAMAGLARLLGKDAPIYAVAFGEGTLATLARVLLEAEAKLRERVCLRVPPYPSLASVGDCLRDLPLAHPMAECEVVEVDYAGLSDLLLDLQLMGESSCCEGATPLSRELVQLAESLYPRENGLLRAEFNLLTLHGWT